MTDREPVSTTRIGIWVFVSLVGLYMLVSGVIGLVNNGG
jgi:hypothetical protein